MAEGNAGEGSALERSSAGPTQKARPEAEGAPESDAASGKKVTRLLSAEYGYSGPLPPPAHLAAYEKIQPGFAERIVKMAEEERGHRASLEKQVVEAKVRDLPFARAEAKRGQTCAVIVSIAAFTTVAFCAWWKCELIGSVLGGATVVGLATAFILGRASKIKAAEEAVPRKVEFSTDDSRPPSSRGEENVRPRQ